MIKKLSAIALLWVALTAPVKSDAAHHASMSSTAVYSLSPGLAFAGGWVGMSFNSVIGVAPISGHEFYIGADLSFDLYLPSAVVINLGILPTAWYQFRLPRSPHIRLVGGLALGPAVMIGGTAGGIGSGVALEFLFRPGFLIDMSDATLFGVDLKIGSVNGVFVFKPTANFVFAF